MIKHSTGALTKEQKKAQDARYNQGHSYDYLIVGSGLSALSAGCLLAHAGKKVCMIEAHDVPGGMAHTFKMGDYEFCAQVHYIWGCAPGGRIYEFLKKIGLEKEITFELLSTDGYDRMVMPDGKQVMIPYGFDRLAKNIEAAYPGQGEKAAKFTGILERIRKELRVLPDRKIKWWEVIFKAYKAPTLIKYLNKTLQDVFDECDLSSEAQAVLIAQAGDFMAPPKELSIFAYCGLFAGYNTGAYYATNHFKHMTERLATFITDHKGCHIYYETKVERFNVKDDRIESVQTGDGKVFTAQTIICNMDPQAAAAMIGWQHFPGSWRKPLQYSYSHGGFIMYLGLKGIDLKKYGFGSFNTWHLAQWDMNKIWQEQKMGDFSKPWVFIATPTLHSKEPGTTPRGGQIMEIETYADFSYWKDLKEKDYRAYTREKIKLADRLLDFVEEHYVPDLRKHIAVKTIGTPSTHEDFCLAPFGNAYGAHLTPKQIGLGRLKADTPFKNFWWCNASSGFGGVHGAIGTGTDLYMRLTGDSFYDFSKAPTDDELIARIRSQKHLID